MSTTPTQTWSINGIEFEAMAEGKALEAGIVQNPECHRLYFFFPSVFEGSELAQLVDEGYLEVFRPTWIVNDRYFALRIKLDAERRFADGSEPANCFICNRTFNFTDGGDNVIMRAPATGPSYACGGDPADYDSACTECIEATDEEEYPEEYEEQEMWAERI